MSRRRQIRRGSTGSSSVSNSSDQGIGQCLAAFLPKTVLAEIMTADRGQQQSQRYEDSGVGSHVSCVGKLSRYDSEITLDSCEPPGLGESSQSLSYACSGEASRMNESSTSVYSGDASVSTIISLSGTERTSLGPRMWPETTGGILMADVYGFTTLMSALTQSSSRRNSNERGDISRGNHRSRHYDPSEQMSLILNNYFGAMVQTVERHGGDVIKFAGDALICYWPTKGNSNFPQETAHCINESDVRRRMARCALELVRDLNEYDVVIGAGRPNEISTTLSLHIACTVMQCKGLHVGGMNGRLEFLLTGSNIGKLGLLLDSAGKGEIAIGEEMYDAFLAEAEPIGDVNSARDRGYAGVPKVFADASVKAVTSKPAGGDAGRVVGYRIVRAHDILSNEENLIRDRDIDELIARLPTIDDAAFEAASLDPRVRAYVPSNVLHYHDHSLANMLSENRTITVVFCSLPSGTCASFESAQKALLKVQKVLHKYKGLLRQFIEDDKATVVIGVWGCPPFSNRNDTSRAIEAALALRDALGPCNIGVATGSCYCGTVGTPDRCEYVVIGNAVNLSARLMGLGKKRAALNESQNVTKETAQDDTSRSSLSRRAGVFCDEATRAAIFAYAEKFEVVDKGQQDFKGLGTQAWNEIELLDSGKTVQTMPMHGREEEMEYLFDALNGAMLSVDDGNPTPFISIIHGPMGMGKSFLTAHFRRKVMRCKLKFEIVDCACAEQEKNTPWYALQGLVPLLWKNVVSLPEESMKAIALLEDISNEATPNQYIEKVEESRKVFTDNLDGETRMANILDLLSVLLSKQMKRTRLMIMVDDLQNCDLNSLKFIDKFIEVCKEKPSRAFLCMSVRPGAPKEVKEVRNKAGKFVRLSRLDPDALQKLTKTELGVPLSSSCDENLIVAIEKSSGGLPLFASETCRFIRRRHLYTYDEENGLCLSDDGDITFGETSSSSPVEATQNAVRYLIDDVSPEARALLKCSSLLPSQFRLLDVMLLSRTMNQSIGFTKTRRTKDAIDEIVANRLWERCGPNGGNSHFRFCHGFMSQTVYYSMTLSQRESLHQAYFALLERATEGEKSGDAFTSSSFEWMASNAALASLHDRAAFFYFQSAQSQHRSFNYVAANASLERAFEHLEVCDSTGDEDSLSGSGIELTVRVQMTRLRGMLCCLLDRPLEGKPLLERALEIAGEGGVLMPADQLPAVVAAETARQQVHRQFDLVGASNVSAVYDAEEDSSMTEESRKLVMRECCSAYDQLARVYLQSGEPLRGIYCCLRGLNLAEMVGKCEELAKAYATYAFVKKSAFYGSRARETAEWVGALAPVTAFCAMLYGGMLIGEGHFKESQIVLRQAVNVSTAVKDIGTLGLSLSVLGWSMFVNGQYNESYDTATEMETIGKEMNDPRFLNWGLTSLFKCVLAMDDADGIRELLPRMTVYMTEYWGSMYNSDKISGVGMLITMHLLNDDLASVRDCMEKYESIVELISKPCTQLVEFYGCVGIIEGLIAVCTQDGNSTSSRLQNVLDAFDDYASSYPIFHARARYLRGKALLIDDSKRKEAIASFRECIAWARRFGLVQFEDLISSLDVATDVFAETIEPKEFERKDDATKGVDVDVVLEGYRKFVNDLEGDGDRIDRLVERASLCCKKLVSIWGEASNTAICMEVQELDALLLGGHSKLLGTNLSRNKVAILALCMADFESCT